MPEDLVTTGTENAGAAAGSTGAGSEQGETTPPAQPSALASLQKAAAAASSADGTVEPPKSAAGTTVQPGQPGANTGAQGEDAAWLAIPEARRNIILENTRKKEAERVQAEYGEIGWAKGLDKDLVASGAQLATQIHSDPIGFAAQLVSEILANPQMAPKLRQALGMGGAPASGQPNAFRSPDGKFAFPAAKLKAEDGKTGAYSDGQVTEILGAFEQYMMDKFGERVAPLEERNAEAAEREEVMEIIHTSRNEATSLMTEMRALPNWPKGGAGSPGEVKISEYLGKIPAERKAKMGSTAALFEAYNTYLEKDVFPSLQSTTGQQVRDDLRRKAAAGSGTVVPGSAQPSQATKKPSNVAELAAHLERLAAAQ